MSQEGHIACCCLRRGGPSILKANKEKKKKKGGERERERNCRVKLGWKTFTTAILEKHSVQIKQVPVCEECNNRFGGTSPSFCLVLFFFFWYSMLSVISSAWSYSCPFRGTSPSFADTTTTTPPASCFAFPLRVSPLLSLVMSLSRRESLGYQCSASDRKRMINKLSCFSSPLYPPSFFLKRGLPLLPTTFLLIPNPPTPSSSSLLPVSSSLSWMAGSHRCVTIITHTLRKK